MAQQHYHIVIKGESRTRGTLTLDRTSAERERGIEQHGGHQADIEVCTADCFDGARRR